MARNSALARMQALFWSVVVSIVLTDAFTKMLAEDRLMPLYAPREVAGNLLRLTLVYNPGAAFGLNLGPYSRWIFTALSLGALALLAHLYRSTRAGDHTRVFALALVCGGAAGNLVDRLKSGRGVVDFIDVGLGTHRWPTFNVADMAVSCGAVALALVLWREDNMAAEREATARGHDTPVHG